MKVGAGGTTHRLEFAENIVAPGWLATENDVDEWAF
jgi:hypothetical protein